MKRILIADDDSNARNILRQILEAKDYQIIQAECGEQAIALATQRHTIDVFMLAIEMACINDFVLCRQLRAIEHHRNTPIIFLTANRCDDLLHQALTIGDDFIQKPYTLVTVEARLRPHFQRLEYAQRLDRVRGILKQYLSKRTLEAIENSPQSEALPGPEERELAICFTDIRGFTAVSEEMAPKKLFNRVSELLADQVNIIHEYGGYVDKFGGDGVMAIFDGSDMVRQSCLCALTMLKIADMKDSGIDQIRRFGIGIHTGRAVVGNIGSPEHLDFSAIGSTVNLAARLCGQAEATSIVVSKAVRDAVGDDPRLKFHSPRQVVIRGFREPVTVYTLKRA